MDELKNSITEAFTNRGKAALGTHPGLENTGKTHEQFFFLLNDNLLWFHLACFVFLSFYHYGTSCDSEIKICVHVYLISNY